MYEESNYYQNICTETSSNYSDFSSCSDLSCDDDRDHVKKFQLKCDLSSIEFLTQKASGDREKHRSGKVIPISSKALINNCSDGLVPYIVDKCHENREKVDRNCGKSTTVLPYNCASNRGSFQSNSLASPEFKSAGSGNDQMSDAYNTKRLPYNGNHLGDASESANFKADSNFNLKVGSPSSDRENDRKKKFLKQSPLIRQARLKSTEISTSWPKHSIDSTDSVQKSWSDSSNKIKQRFSKSSIVTDTSGALRNGFDYDKIDQTKKREMVLRNKIVSSQIASLQGIEVLCSLPIMYLYKDAFGIDPSALAIILGSLRIPWTVKPLWAICSDCLPIFGYRRKSYIVIGSLLCFLSFLFIGIFGYKNIFATSFLLICYFLGSAICNVIGEALVVEEGRAHTNPGQGAANAVSFFFAFRKLSFAFMSYLSGLLLRYVTNESMFLIGSLVPLLVFASSFFIEDEKKEPASVTRQLRVLYSALSQPSLMSSSFFIFLMMCTPSTGTVMFYFMTNKLNFGPEVLGTLSFIQYLASLVGIFVYLWFFTRTNIRKLLFWSTLIVTPFCLLPIIVVQRCNLKFGIPDGAFIISDSFLMEFIGEFQSIPILVLAATLCPPGLESSIYSFLIASYNLGLSIGNILSASLTAAFAVSSTNFQHLSWLILTCTLTNFLPLFVLFMIPKNPVGIRTLEQVKEEIPLLKDGSKTNQSIQV